MFEDLVKLTKLPQQTANWLLGEMLREESNQIRMFQDHMQEGEE